MLGGYGSICKREIHRPGSLLYYNTLAPAGGVPRVVAKIDSTAAGSGPLGLLSKNRFAPDPAVRSLAYRYDGVNMDTPNAYPEFTSSCRGDYEARYNTGQRKDTAGCTSCKAPKQTDGGQPGLDPILDPKFNLREVAKHMILLEDHLFQRGRRCDDCINKHRLTLEAFLEEAITLDKTGEHRAVIVDTLSRFKQIMRDFVDRVRRNPVANVDAVYYETADRLRVLRKPLCMAYCDFC